VLAEMPNKELDIYIHVPFCHVNCTFCHFYKEIIPRNRENDFEARYIDGLLAEVENYEQVFQGKIRPRTIQFGGGTPSALSVQGLKALLMGLRARLDLSALTEVKFEFHPDMINDVAGYRERLRILRDFGLSTAIIDLESTDPKVLKTIGRGNTSREAFETLVGIAVEEGIASVASAYMTGLPFETLDSFENTLAVLSAIKHIDTINLYPLMFKPSDAIFRQRRRNPSMFASPYEKDLMMVLATEVLGAAGFVEGPCHFFRRDIYIPEQQISKAESRTLLGLGPASFGYIDGPEYGMQYMNYPDLDRYLSAIAIKHPGIWRSSTLN
jgi:oxygen-independent coproporphyrinogen III oxidase